MSQTHSLVAVVPAAGVGSRMQADRPKQYLSIDNKTVLEHTVDKLLSHPEIKKVIVAVSEGDPFFPTLSLANHPDVIRVAGGLERADSVLSALNYLSEKQDFEWVLVHDAARPCVKLESINELIETATGHEVGAILASPVRDTMKRSTKDDHIDHTVERSNLWHALTPQMFKVNQLKRLLEEALFSGISITDEASAFEWKGMHPAIVNGEASNIKITQPEDLALAEFYLKREKETA
ncbi:2-C-methyl-D-erythritol 4-phosphate cytidylyltransferase [Vibrio sonorensis]|uniref:2-C-methyl-D-erythritol 4-phosphate cytidylyltransferase n=1 Tax=Vibrio sonorensis TaxID=1004316 RepID=UPI0008DAA3AD|nr:2-C-methyl-D-erythritol 4-phosphate cytidylyltransferase [Vibrio sonorensis]